MGSGRPVWGALMHPGGERRLVANASLMLIHQNSRNTNTQTNTSTHTYTYTHIHTNTHSHTVVTTTTTSPVCLRGINVAQPLIHPVSRSAAGWCFQHAAGLRIVQWSAQLSPPVLQVTLWRISKFDIRVALLTSFQLKYRPTLCLFGRMIMDEEMDRWIEGWDGWMNEWMKIKQGRHVLQTNPIVKSIGS